MKSCTARLGGLLLAIIGGLAAAEAAATSTLSAAAPIIQKARHVETLRMSPDAGALRIELPALASADVDAVREANTQQFEKRLQIGIGRPLSGDRTAIDALSWEAVP